MTIYTTAEPFTAEMAPDSFKARGERFTKEWARFANGSYAGLTNPKGRNLSHGVAMEKAAIKATSVSCRGRRLSV